jgi:hypothetical protein
MLCLFAAPQYAFAAYDPFSSVCSGGGAGSTVCNTQLSKDPNGKSVDPFNQTLQAITDIVAFVAGIAAIIIIIISALRLISSGSDVSTGSRTDTDVEDARRSIANAIIGLVVIVLARIVVIYLLNRV